MFDPLIDSSFFNNNQSMDLVNHSSSLFQTQP